jgi:hypothetical protein
MSKWPKCWCGALLIEEVDGFPLGFLNCPVHGCHYEQAPDVKAEATSKERKIDWRVAKTLNQPLIKRR